MVFKQASQKGLPTASSIYIRFIKKDFKGTQ